MWDLIVSVPDHCLSFYFPICPHSYEDINPEINRSQMLHSARFYQSPPTNVLCCFQTTNTAQTLHWQCYSYIMQPSQPRLSCIERKGQYFFSLSINYTERQTKRNTCISRRNFSTACQWAIFFK